MTYWVDVMTYLCNKIKEERPSLVNWSLSSECCRLHYQVLKAQAFSLLGPGEHGPFTVLAPDFSTDGVPYFASFDNMYQWSARSLVALRHGITVLR